MANYKRRKSNSKKFAATASMGAVTAIFAAIAVVLIVIGYKDDIMWWMKTLGISFAVVAAACAVFVIHLVVDSAIRKM